MAICGRIINTIASGNTGNDKWKIRSGKFYHFLKEGSMWKLAREFTFCNKTVRLCIN